MEKYRVIVVDDSRFMRKIITDIIESDPQFTVVGTAENGKEALLLIDTVHPDLITLDLEMPEMNGIEALQVILKKHKIPVIMLSGISESNTQDTIRALQYGAFDFIRKPTSVSADKNDIVSTGELLIEKMKIAVLTKRRREMFDPVVEPVKNIYKSATDKSKEINIIKERLEKEKLVKSKVIIAPLKTERKEKSVPTVIPPVIRKEKTTSLVKPTVNKEKPVFIPKVAEKTVNVVKNDNLTEKVTQIVAIGTSTGGPRALHEVISNIPAGILAPIVVVQHMPPKFTHSLAQRLDSFSELKVVEATPHMELKNGHVYIAPGGYHMKVIKVGSQYQISLSTEPPRNGHRPSVDVLFESLLDFKELERHVVIMTGMGSDGAQSMKALYEQGVHSTIAEAEQSCVVYGMPRSAVELGVVEKVVPLTQIAPEIIRKVMKRALY